MNFLIFFSLMWSIHTAYSDTFPPATVLYFPLSKTYALSERKVVQNMVEATDLRIWNFTHVLLYCSEDYDEGENSVLIEGEAFDDVTKALKSKKNCKLNYQPGPFYVVNGYTDGVGYLISEKSSKLTDKYKIPAFPANAGDKMVDLPVIWYDKTGVNKYTTQTVHNFYLYNRCLLPTTSCEDYTLAKKMDNQETIEKAIAESYTESKQDEHFAKIKFEESRRTQNGVKQYLVAHKMVPLDDFVEDSMRMAACTTYFTTTPIWKSISEGPIKIVEEFIQALAERVYVGTLRVRTQTFQSLLKGSRINLPYNGGQIPIPRFFLKIVSYRPPTPFEDDEPIRKEDNSNRFYMAIVVNNDLSKDTHERICNKNKKPTCKDNGWKVTADGSENGNVYCCTFNDEGLQGRVKHNGNHAPLNLKTILIPIDISVSLSLPRVGSKIEEKTGSTENKPAPAERPLLREPSGLYFRPSPQN